MPKSIGREAVRTLVAEGAQLVEVLPPEEFGDEHLPGAINIPLKELTAERARQLDPASPVIVYCWDNQ